MSNTDDLIIIGGGPCGLSAAINAASEGLSVRLIDDMPRLGGQALESNAIENYPGFPSGITGEALMSAMVVQAMRFNVVFSCPLRVHTLYRDDAGNIVVMTDDYQNYTARSVLLALGLQYRRLMADNIGSMMGRGVYYGMPPFAIPRTKQCIVGIVGGANSAGQAALKVAENKKATVHMFIRKTIGHQMSTYLVERILDTKNIMVCEGCEVRAVFGQQWLTHVAYSTPDNEYVKIKMDDMFIFIGAVPRTLWLDGSVQLDESRYVRTGGGVTPSTMDMKPMHYETSIPGVFAAGDVRAYSTKRISAAVGEGSAVVQMIHRYLNPNGEV